MVSRKHPIHNSPINTMPLSSPFHTNNSSNRIIKKLTNGDYAVIVDGEVANIFFIGIKLFYKSSK